MHSNRREKAPHLKPVKSRSALRAFLAGEASSGIVLILAAALAMIAANASTGSAAFYHALLRAPFGPVLSSKLGPMTPHLWINDGLMALFFLLVGLEIKREFLDGRLQSRDQRRLPIIAATAGMIAPAIVYLAVTSEVDGLVNGWAIPAATDIAFAIGVLALLGSRAPIALKLFLTTVAIVDDMGAVAIIAIAYTPALNLVALAWAVAILGGMILLNRRGCTSLTAYLIAFVALWFAILLSGVHATIAGVLAAMTIPLRATPGTPDASDSPLHILEHRLHPWSAYLIVPLFGFANAGVSLSGLAHGDLVAPLPLGIALGLFVGKQLGIFGSIWISVRLGWASRLRGATWLQVYGVSILCGIGFTMSLFIGALAFPAHPALIEDAKIGILMGSILAAIAGYAILRLAPLHPDHAAINAQQDREIDADGDVAGI